MPPDTTKMKWQNKNASSAFASILKLKQIAGVG